MSTTRFVHRPAAALIALLLLGACSPWLGARGSSEGTAQSASAPASIPAVIYPQYLSLAEGLHVTGTPIEVDPDTYRLKVGGLVDNPLVLTLEEVRALPRERLFFSLTCPGFFTDQGFWTGVRLGELLRLARYKPGAAAVEFTSVDGGYTQRLPLQTVLDTNVLVAYQFDDRDFPVYHGFPLRIAAEGQPGAVWVKWLGSITVTN